MATSKEEQRAFIRKYQPAADVASKILFIPAEVLLAQWAKEADWGKKESGDFNFAGIKSFNPDEPRKEVQTWEVLTPAEVKELKAQGKKVTPRPGVKNGYNIVDYFKSYDSPEQFAKEYSKTLIQSYPQAVGSENIEDFAYAIDSGRAQGEDSGFKVYATDPNYAKGLEEIYKYNVIPRKNEIIAEDKGLDVSGPIGLPDLKNKEDIKRVQKAIGVKADGVWGPKSKEAWKQTNDLFVTDTYRQEGMQRPAPKSPSFLQRAVESVIPSAQAAEFEFNPERDPNSQMYSLNPEADPLYKYSRPSSASAIGMLGNLYTDKVRSDRLDAMGEVVSPPLAEIPQRYSFEEQQAMSDLMSGVGADYTPTPIRGNIPKIAYNVSSNDSPPKVNYQVTPSRENYMTMEELLMDKGLMKNPLLFDDVDAERMWRQF